MVKPRQSRKGKYFGGMKKIVLLDVGKLSAVSGKPKTAFLRKLPPKMVAEIEKNWKTRQAAQKAAGKRVWTSDSLLRPGDPFTSRKHSGKVFVPVEQGGIDYKAHLEGNKGKVILRECLKHPIKRARSMPYAIGLDVITIIRTPEGKRFLYMQKRSNQVQEFKGAVHFQPAKYPRAEKKSSKANSPFLSFREQVLRSAEIEVGIPANRIKLLGPGLKPAGKGDVSGFVIRGGAKGNSQVNLAPVIEVRATKAEVESFQKKAEHSWETASGPILVELTPKNLRAFFRKNQPIYPKLVELLIKEVRNAAKR